MKNFILLFFILLGLIGCELVNDTEYEEKCYQAENEGCIIYDGMCLDSKNEIIYSRCCDNEYAYFIFNEKTFYTLKDMYNGVCKEEALKDKEKRNCQ